MKTFAMLLVLLVIAGCSRVPPPEVWVSGGLFVSEKLSLNSDRTYEYSFDDDLRDPVITRGTWSAHSNQITLTPSTTGYAAQTAPRAFVRERCGSDTMLVPKQRLTRFSCAKPNVSIGFRLAPAADGR